MRRIFRSHQRRHDDESPQLTEIPSEMSSHPVVSPQNVSASPDMASPGMNILPQDSARPAEDALDGDGANDMIVDGQGITRNATSAESGGSANAPENNHGLTVSSHSPARQPRDGDHDMMGILRIVLICHIANETKADGITSNSPADDDGVSPRQHIDGRA